MTRGIDLWKNGAAEGRLVMNTQADAGHGSDEDRRPLDMFFRPRAVAVIGASDKPGSVGRALLWNLISSPFGGTVYAVNPKRHNVLGILAYKSVREIPEPVDLAVVVTPASTVPAVVGECAEAGVKGVLIISAGFQETGAPGWALAEEVRQRAAAGGVRVIGPNSLGVMNPSIGLNAAYNHAIALKGTVGFVSQSGALCAAILDWSFRTNVGFSSFVSFGSMVEVSWADLIYHLGSDAHTRSIVMYMQSLGDARSFISAAREVALHKPIIVLKAGQTEMGVAAAKNTAYYSAGDDCDDAVLSAAFRRSGVLRVNRVEDLFNLAEVLGKQPRPRGPRLTVLSNSAGPGILATDALIKEGCELADLSQETRDGLDALLPSYWSHSNPIDIVADADAERYAKAIEIALADENSDGVLTVLTPQVMTDATATAAAIAGLKRPGNKPLLASWMGGDTVAKGDAILNAKAIPTFGYPDEGARVFSAMWRYTYNLRGLYETPDPAPIDGAGRDEAAALIAAARDAGETVLREIDSKRLLAAYGVPAAETHEVFEEAEAVSAAAALGYPVVLKLNYTPESRALSSRYTRPHLGSAKSVRAAFDELMVLREEEGTAALGGVTVRPMVPGEGYRMVLGSYVDHQFGPVLYFGSGGPLGRVISDRVIALPPLNTTLARRAMEQTRVYAGLREGRGGKPIDVSEVEQILVLFSRMVIEQRWIRSVDINPLLAAPAGTAVLDARVILHGPDTCLDSLPRLAIRPYPAEYVWETPLKDEQVVVIRPIRPEDETMMVRFHETLSKDSVYFRYLRLLALDQRIKHERLAELCFMDYDRAMALVSIERGEDGAERILGIVQMVKLHGSEDADFAILVSDTAQGRGLGTRLMRHLVRVAAAEGVRRLVGIVHPDNRAMLRLCGKVGFELHKPVGGEVEATCEVAGKTDLGSRV